MKIFSEYLKQRWRGLLAFILFCIIFTVSFILYHLPVEAVIYPTTLCILFGLIFVIIDFHRIKRKHKLLNNIQGLTDAILATLPSIESIEDEDYQRILSLLCDEHKAYQTDTNRRYSDMIDFYTVWVHQIKTPIASMRLHLQNEDTELSRRLLTDLSRIERYVEMVLTFLRLNSESTDYVFKEYDLDTIIRYNVKKFAQDFINKKLRLVYEPLNVTVITDEKWLSFVIEQVLSNALKYTPSGSITIILKPDKQLCICDTGIGIATEDLPRIFENGFTGHNGRYDKKASGIGLYLCKRICSNLGHNISATSTVDEGTVITIDLAQKKLDTE